MHHPSKCRFIVQMLHYKKTTIAFQSRETRIIEKKNGRGIGTRHDIKPFFSQNNIDAPVYQCLCLSNHTASRYGWKLLCQPYNLIRYLFLRTVSQTNNQVLIIVTKEAMGKPQKWRNHSLTFPATSNVAGTQEECLVSRGTDLQVISLENKKRKNAQKHNKGIHIPAQGKWTLTPTLQTTQQQSHPAALPLCSMLKHHETREATLKTDTIEKRFPHNLSLLRTRITKQIHA